MVGDNRNLTIDDIQSWARSAPPEQVTQAASKLLEQVSGYPDSHRQTFQKGMSAQTRKLFQGEPVG